MEGGFANVTLEKGGPIEADPSDEQVYIEVKQAITPGGKGIARQLQLTPISMAVINRCMGQTAVFSDDQTLQLMSAFVSSPLDIPDKDKWVPMEIDGVKLLIDQYTAQICLYGVIVTKWEPDGIDTAAFPGLVMNFVQNDTKKDDFVQLPSDKIIELAQRQRRLAQEAYGEINALTPA